MKRNQWFAGFAFVSLLLSAALNVALAVRVSQQREALESGETAVQLQIGRRMEPFDARDATGRVVRLEVQAAGRPTVLYAFRDGCAWCERNHEAVVALHSQLSDRYNFIGIALGEEYPHAMLDRNPLPFDVVWGIEKETLETYQLGGTPRTLVLDAEGTIEANYFGAYIGGTRREVLARFNLDLPVVYEGDSR